MKEITSFIPSSGDDPALVWAVGDGGIDGPQANALADRIAASDPDRLLYLGDVYGPDDGGAQDFEENYEPVYGELDEVTAPTGGNHEWPSHEEGYDPYWSEVHGPPTPPYYKFSVGGWRVLSLNSEEPHEAGSPQLEWIKDEMRRGQGTCTIAMSHRPRFSAGEHGDYLDIEPVWSTLSGHASIMLSGHDHGSQRLEPQDGITQLVAGAGGVELSEVDESDRRLAFSNDTDVGAYRLTLRPGSASFAFITVDGRTLDTGRIPCDPG